MLDWIADTVFQRAKRQLYQRVKQEKPLCVLWFYPPVAYRQMAIPAQDNSPRWRACMLVVDQRGVTVYPSSPKMDERIDFPREALRWFGRPHKYQPGNNDIWLHFELDGRWQVIEFRIEQSGMQALVRALKQIATPEQVTMYRRHRPYVHFDATPAYHAEQDIYGAWTVFPVMQFAYLMPYALVILQGNQVKRVIPLAQIQDVEALRRLDALDADGVVRFKIVTGEIKETFALTMAVYLPFAAALAEAAKRTLELPLMKKKEDADDWEDEE